jgi:hypothetical protein
MFLAMKSRRQRDADERPSVGQRCASSGCTCYCHKPVPDPDLKFLIFPVLMGLGALCMVFSVPFIIGKLIQDANKGTPPPTPYYCAGLTSTGAPADCHPAILSPEVQKLYEQQWKDRHQ